MINITFPDGTVKPFPSGSTAFEIASSISQGLARETVVARCNDELIDLSVPLTTDCRLEFLKFSDISGKKVFWHTTAHVCAQAVKRLFPQALPTIGPPIEEGGFYYDFADLNITQEDLKKIENEMKNIVQEGLTPQRIEYSTVQEAREANKDNPYKLAIIDDYQNETLSAYKQGEFIDICKGPHIPRLSMIKAIKLTKLAGAYWRGDAKNEQLTRIYGIGFPENKLLREYEELVAEAARRDHRKIAQEMELFTVDEDIGPGMVLWLPKGNIIKEELERWAKETEQQWGYQRVTTPLITKEGLFHTSEHLPHYTESMFPPMEFDNEKYYIKPMNCPFHHKIFSSRTRSYRELPLRIAEYGWCHRYEQSGALFGLMRVRGMQMNDAHIYCEKKDAVKEFVDVIRLHQYYYEMLGITEYSMELALRDPQSDKYHGDDSMWAEAEELMRKAMELSKVPYTIDVGGAAFYGPKIDFQIKSVIGRSFTASTNQIDLFMPEKFGLTYAGEDGSVQVPVCIHRAPLGTHERFIGFLIEHFAGRFPLWLAPEQIAVLPISKEQGNGANELVQRLKERGLRAVLETGDTLNKRVRDAQLRRIPLMVILGEKELSTGTVAVRTLDGKTTYGVSVDNFVQQVTLNRNKRKLTLPTFANIKTAQ